MNSVAHGPAAARILVGGVRYTERDVGADRVGEQERLVEDHRHRRVQRMGIQVAHVDVVSAGADGDRPGNGPVVAAYQVGKGGFARTGRTDNGHIPRVPRRGDAVEHRAPASSALTDDSRSPSGPSGAGAVAESAGSGGWSATSQTRSTADLASWAVTSRPVTMRERAVIDAT